MVLEMNGMLVRSGHSRAGPIEGELYSMALFFFFRLFLEQSKESEQSIGWFAGLWSADVIYKLRFDGHGHFSKQSETNNNNKAATAKRQIVRHALAQMYQPLLKS